MIVSPSLIMTLVVYPSLAMQSSLITVLVRNIYCCYHNDYTMLLIGEPPKMSYDSGISSGPPGGMFSSSKL